MLMRNDNDEFAFLYTKPSASWNRRVSTGSRLAMFYSRSPVRTSHPRKDAIPGAACVCISGDHTIGDARNLPGGTEGRRQRSITASSVMVQMKGTIAVYVVV